MSEVTTVETRSGSRPRRRVVVLLVLAFLVLVGFGFSRPVLAASAQILNVGSEPEEADLIFLLGGDIHSRPSKAVELYKQGLAPRILLARAADTEATRIGAFPNETDATVLMLEKLGVPDSAIVVLTPPMGVSSTTAEAVELRKYLEVSPASRVMVVTSAYHTRRARWQIRRQLDEVPVEIRMVAVEDPRFDASNWWRSEAGVLAYGEEYLKFIHNWVYGVTGRR
jgi:uncharacterized SAM-binding protein YcdF (DUF218 family)